MANSLRNTVAVVTGASRGAGKAIAGVLGERGATVYVTGRTTRGTPAVDGLPGTIEDTADEVTARGGRGIPVQCDHTIDEQAEALFHRVRREQGKLNLLVNNAWGGYEGFIYGLSHEPFWKQPWRQWDGMMIAGVRSTLFASRLAAPIMIEAGRGLIVHTIAWLDGKYLQNIFYDLAKRSMVHLAEAMATELKKHGVGALALAPGWMRTERILAAHAAHPFDLSATETPEYCGRAVAALASDPDPTRWSGQTVYVGDLAREYGFTDVDGRQVPVFGHSN